MTHGDIPHQSPYYHAQHIGRYDRQDSIARYQDEFECNLVVVIDDILQESITLFEEVVQDIDLQRPLHVMLVTQGGHGETAVKLARAAQARCKHLTVVVPDIAKSAGTLIALGAHQILMGSTSDLGPIDPQFQLTGSSGLVAAKDIVATLRTAEHALDQNPDAFPLYLQLMGDLTGPDFEKAESELAQAEDLLRLALAANPERSATDTDQMTKKLSSLLIDAPNSHAAVFGLQECQAAGLPVHAPGPQSRQWQLLWRLWAKYYALPATGIYESARASIVLDERRDRFFN